MKGKAPKGAAGGGSSDGFGGGSSGGFGSPKKAKGGRKAAASPPRMPVALICHICGMKFGSASLKIHVP